MKSKTIIGIIDDQVVKLSPRWPQMTWQNHFVLSGTPNSGSSYIGLHENVLYEWNKKENIDLGEENMILRWTIRRFKNYTMFSLYF